MKCWLRVLGFGLLWLMMGQTATAAEFPRGTLTIAKADGETELFDVEFATTPEQQHYGLMFRFRMPYDSGMLFLFSEEQKVQFWMKNTYVPLDLLFAKPDGVIVQIIPDMKMEDETVVSSNEPVSQVLEIVAGESKKRGIKVGDKMAFSVKK